MPLRPCCCLPTWRRTVSLALLLAAGQAFALTEEEEAPDASAPPAEEQVEKQQPQLPEKEEGEAVQDTQSDGKAPVEEALRQAEDLRLDLPIEGEEQPAEVKEETPENPAEGSAEEVPAQPQQKAPEETPGKEAAPQHQEQRQESGQREPEQPTEAQSEERETGAPSQEAVEAQTLRLLGTEVPPATSTRLAWSPSQHFEGVYSSTAVLVVNGAKPGPTLCLTAAVHGDELNGIETVRRVMYNLDKDKLQGAVIGVPIVNLQGFHRGSRYLTDRRDLNRHFPGHPDGSSASRIAYSFFHEVVTHCNAIVDLHTGSFYRTNLPQLRGDLSNPKVVKMTKGFGSTVVLHSEGAKGTLRRSAVEAGIPTITLEAGAPMVLDERSVSHSVKGIRTLLNQLGMVSKFRLWGDPEPVYYNSTWQRATNGGIIFSEVSLGQFVSKGDLLGTVTNPITNVRTEIRSEHNGRILGMALNQVVQPGFAAYHIGIQAPQEQISPPEEVTADSEQSQPATEKNAEEIEPSPAEQADDSEAQDIDEGRGED